MTGLDFSSVISAVDFAGVNTGLMAMTGLMMIPCAIYWGGRKILRFLG